MAEIHPDFELKTVIRDHGKAETLLQLIDEAHYVLVALLAKNGLTDAKYLHASAQFLLAARVEAEKYSG